LNISDADLATLTADATLFEGKLNTFNTADAVYSKPPPTSRPPAPPSRPRTRHHPPP